MSRVCVCIASLPWSGPGAPLLSTGLGRITKVPGGMSDNNLTESVRLLCVGGGGGGGRGRA